MPSNRRQYIPRVKQNTSTTASDTKSEKQLPYWLQYVTALAGLVSIVLAAWAIWVSFDLAERDKTEDKLTNLIDQVVQQNEKLDRENKALETQITELRVISERSVATVEELSKIQKVSLSSSKSILLNTQPKMIMTGYVSSKEYTRNRIILETGFQNAGDRQAYNFSADSYFMENDSLGILSIFDYQYCPWPGISSKGYCPVAYAIDKEKIRNKTIIVNHDLAYYDRLQNKEIKESFYITLFVDNECRIKVDSITFYKIREAGYAKALYKPY